VALTEKDVRLIRLFAAAVLGRWEELARIRRDAPEGEPDRAWREAILQTHLFAGFPRTIEAFEVLKRAGGIGAPEADELDACVADGHLLFDRIYAELAGGVRARIAGFHPELAGWILEHAYGRVLSRGGLSADRRELLAVVALALTGQERQLMSHLRGAVRCGATPEEVSGALEVVSHLLSDGDREAIRPLIDRFAVREAT
jgi:alkylhydroperoxidase/carboxymuconolactone decarboxylase family protein YurZ